MVDRSELNKMLIVFALNKGFNISAAARHFGVTPAAIRHHLDVLRGKK